MRERMKKAFAECYRAVLACEDESGRKRCELFRDLPDKRVSLIDFFSMSNLILFLFFCLFQKDYPDYYQLIVQPIALSHLRKRANSNYYKTVQQYRSDWNLMFNNARTYNQEGSWVYVDANEMEKVFDRTFNRLIAGSDMPGAPPPAAGSTGSYESALTPMEEDERPLPARSRSAGRKQVISDEEYLTASDDD